jgi:hypothetical protein
MEMTRSLSFGNSIHLPIKKDHLKKINIPKPADDKDIDNILKEVVIFDVFTLVSTDSVLSAHS